MKPMIIAETDRLILRRLTHEDKHFILRLVNEPSWLRFIGDRNVHSPEDAVRYITDGPMAMYAKYGFGLFLVVLKGSDTPIGMCGLLKRDTLEHADIGFAFLPEYWGQGYAYEAAAATMAYGQKQHGLNKIIAITSPDNASSIKLLKKLGLVEKEIIQLPGYSGETLVME